MHKVKSITLLMTVNVLAMAMPQLSLAEGQRCQQVLSGERTRGLEEAKVDWLSDRSYLETSQRKEVLGQVETFFSKKWDTQVYYTKTAQPDSKGRVPFIDPNAKAVYIFFHGSGTMKSGGRNFIPNMNALANLGFAAVSVDLPFHGEGPRDPSFNNSNHFMEWVRAIVLEAKKSGKPVYLAGHSFGPDVILEFAARYPKTIDGVVALSPAGFTKTLANWYDNFTSKMKFGGDVAENDDGGIWAAVMSKQFLWSRQKLADPTQVNPNLKIRILSGDREEYVPAPLGGEGNTPIGTNTYDVTAPLMKMFKNATVTIEPNIGHYLFEHLDRHGHNVVMRELLMVADLHPSQLKTLTEQTRKESELNHTPGQLAKKYSQDPLFKSWSDQTYGPGKVLQLAGQNIDNLAQKILDQYSYAAKVRDAEIFKKIINSKETHPEFYEKYKTIIDKQNPQKVDNTLFVPYLNLVLKSGG